VRLTAARNKIWMSAGGCNKSTKHKI
jgi:hypothetical protein